MMSVIFQRTEPDLKRLIDSSAHDLTGPLSNARMMAQFLKNKLPEFLARSSADENQSRLQAHFEEAQLAAEDMIRVTTKGLALLQGQVSYMQHLLLAEEEKEEVLLSALIQSAIEEYPFSSPGLRSNFEIKDQSPFSIWGSQIILRDLLDFLIEDTLLSVQSNPSVHAHIWTEKSPNQMLALHFKVIGVGFPERAVSTIFNRFFVVRDDQVRSGLGFAVFAINYLKGRASCESTEGEFKHFIFEFSRNIA